MGAGTSRLLLELDIIDDSLAGHVTTSSGEIREFTGWLGLLSTLQALLPPIEPCSRGEEPIQ